tara:strand:+ start:461 stop:1180 length:720 start_codon:yes stop_codon:yes gene_type:complete
MNLFNNKFLEDFSTNLIYYNAEDLIDVNLEKVNHIFKTNDISYIPILKRQTECLGVISRKKYFFSLLSSEVFDIKSVIVQMQEISLESPLDKTLLKLKDEPGLLLRIDGKIKKFISPRVVSNAFASYSKKFMMIEKVEFAIRKFIQNNKIDFIKILKEKNLDKKSLNKQKEIDDLFFFDYGIIFNGAWEDLDLYKKKLADKKMFLSSISKIGQIRNDLLHFRYNLEFEKKHIEDILKII